MRRHGTLKQNHGHPAIAVSQFFMNRRQREKYIGRRGELVADLCECEGKAKLYLHDGVNCGGIPVVAETCGPSTPLGDICDMLDSIPDNGNTIPGVKVPPYTGSGICGALGAIPDNGRVI